MSYLDFETICKLPLRIDSIEKGIIQIYDANDKVLFEGSGNLKFVKMLIKEINKNE